MNKVKKKKLIILFSAVVLICMVFILLNIPFHKIYSLSQNSIFTVTDLSNLEKESCFGPFIKVNIKSKAQQTFNTCQECEPEIEFKLFNLIPLKTQKVKILKDDKLLVGGNAIGLVLKTDGVLVVGSSPIITESGEYDVIESGLFEIGDVITQIEDETVENVSSIATIVNKEENINRELNIKGVRKNKEFNIKVKPCYDVKSEKYKLGVWVRDDASGVGTLTFVDSNNRFGALGHPICDGETKTLINVKEGKVYNCSVLGVNKGSNGSPGEIKGLFMQGKNEQGIIEKNNKFGIFGEMLNTSSLINSLTEFEIGSRFFVKPGKAQIRCCIDGEKVETFDIEIIKTNYQNYSNDKSMVIKVVDEDLLERTGGIVQGMSGSPIIQNGKIVGAVTHVFINDSSKGFGVYVDWMLGQ